MLSYLFFRHALLGVLLISVIAGIVGTYVVTRRQASLAGGVTHACFGGLGLGYFLGWNPLWPAMTFAVGASGAVEWLSRDGRVRADSATAVVWALGMAMGVLFVFLTPGYVPELNAFLFGNILAISTMDLWLCGAFAVGATGAMLLWGRIIAAYAFDPDFARVSGMPVRLISPGMTLMVSVGIVLTIRLAGVMLLMSMLVLPPMTAERLTHSYGRVALLATLVAALTGVGALWLSAVVNVPCAAFIVLLQGLAYLLSRLR